MSTMAKTRPSYLLSVVLPEKVMGVIKPGTHDWNKFVDCDDLCGMIVGAKDS